jgi:ATP-dependent DNA helicase RecG
METNPGGLAALVKQKESQYFDRKSLWHRQPGNEGPRDRRVVRDEIAQYVAAFANADGGTLVLGVENDGSVTGHGYPPDAVSAFLDVPLQRLSPPLARGRVERCEGMEILVFEVQSALRAVMVGGDGFPRRVGDTVVCMSEEEINAIKRRGEVESVEREPVPQATLAHLDEGLLSRAIAASGLQGTDTADYLVARRLADRRGSELVLTNAAILLFARSASVIEHPNAGIRIFRVAGAEARSGVHHNVEELQRIEGALPLAIERARAVLSTLIRKSTRLHDLFFRETPEYPTFAWQEGIVNAVAHRDYRRQGNSVELWLFEDRLEVRSPGGLVPEISLDALQARTRVHSSRNPRIARVLAEMGIMREQGEGIPRIFEEMEGSYLPLPELAVIGSTFVLTLRNQPIFDVGDPQWVRHLQSLPLNNRQRRILAARRRSAFTSGDYQSLNKVDRDTAYRELRGLVEQGIVAPPLAPGRGAVYRVLRAEEVTIPEAEVPVGAAALVQGMERRGFVTSADYQAAFGLNRFAAWAALRDLVAASVLERKGVRRGAKYFPGPQWQEFAHAAQFNK